jgi:Flp pilus assembly pilin Flp
MLLAITKLEAWWEDEGGLETAEWALLLGAVLVPLAYFIYQIGNFVARFYELTSWVSTLPFP